VQDTDEILEFGIPGARVVTSARQGTAVSLDGGRIKYHSKGIRGIATSRTMLFVCMETLAAVIVFDLVTFEELYRIPVETPIAVTLSGSESSGVASESLRLFISSAHPTHAVLFYHARRAGSDFVSAFKCSHLKHPAGVAVNGRDLFVLSQEKRSLLKFRIGFVSLDSIQMEQQGEDGGKDEGGDGSPSTPQQDENGGKDEGGDGFQGHNAGGKRRRLSDYRSLFFDNTEKLRKLQEVGVSTAVDGDRDDDSRGGGAGGDTRVGKWLGRRLKQQHHGRRRRRRRASPSPTCQILAKFNKSPEQLVFVPAAGTDVNTGTTTTSLGGSPRDDRASNNQLPEAASAWLHEGTGTVSAVRVRHGSVQGHD
jgi:hypothetical protein